MWWVMFIGLLVALAIWLRFDYVKGLERLRKQPTPTLTNLHLSQLKLFSSGEDFFDCLLDDVAKAKKHVHVQFYIFRSDQIGKRVIEALCNKATEGVEVRLLVDQFGCKLTHSLKKKLSKAGVEFQCASSIRGPFFFFSINRRNHRKLAIIDGEISYIGGFNVGDEYLGRDPFFGFWRDFHIRITGEGSASIQKQFLYDFQSASKNKLPSRNSFYPKLDPGKQPLQFLSTQGQGLERQLLHTIAKATDSLIINTPYFIPTERLQQALLEAAGRGVNVSLVLPEKADHPLVKHGATPFLLEALQAGILVYHYYRGFYHVKAIIVDRSHCLLGTSNFDRRSFHLNDEMNFVTDDPLFIKEVLNVIEYDIKSSTCVTLEKLKQRPLLDKIKEFISALFASLL